MLELLQEFTLLDKHRVYRDGNDFRVTIIDKHGIEHTQIISSLAIECLRQQCKGKTVTTQEAAKHLSPMASELDLPFTGGHKLDYYTQEMLLVLTAVGMASMEKKSRKYIYKVN